MCYFRQTLYAAFILVCIGISSIVIISCENFSGPKPATTNPPNIGSGLGSGSGGTTGGTNSGMMTTSQCDTANVTFSNTVRPILETNCVGCHSGAGATAGVDVSTYQGLKRVVDAGRFPNVLTASSGAPQMPPGSRLSPCDIAKIQAWVRKGARND
jgi:hypothetical protein